MTGSILGVVAACFLAPSLASAQAPAGGASGTTDQPAPANAPPKPAEARFDILDYVVDGNTVLSVPDIEEAIYPFLGEQRTAADVDSARAALENAYVAKGFQTVQVGIPQQGIETGIIHLQVVENPVGRLRVVGAKYHTLSAIEANAPSLAEGKVPNAAALQDDVVALNSQPDLKVTPHLAAGREAGTVDVDLQVEDHFPLHGSLEVNNQYNENTTPLRTLATVSYGNLWQLGHTVSLSYQIAPENPSDARVFSGSYLAPIPRTDLSVLLYGVKSDSNVAAVAGTNVLGRGGIIGVTLTKNLPGDESFYQSATATFARKDLTQNVVTGGTPANAPVLYYPIALAYSATATDGQTTTQADASVNFATPGIDSSSPKFDAQRFDGRPDYIYFKADASRTQPLPGAFVGYIKLDGQITGDSLLNSEQYSAGGFTTVRGYLEAERLGDYGAHMTTELRSPSLATYISPRVNDWHFLVFFDGAALALRQPLVDEKSTFRIASTGIGTQLTSFDALNAVADIAFPLVDGDVTKAWNPFINFRVWSEF